MRLAHERLRGFAMFLAAAMTVSLWGYLAVAILLQPETEMCIFSNPVDVAPEVQRAALTQRIRDYPECFPSLSPWVR